MSLSAKPTQYIPPWKSPYIIGIAGFSGSGKTTVAQKIIQEINEPWTVLQSLDNFYRPLTPEQSKLAFKNEWDLDRPDALDQEMIYECVKSLKEGKRTEIPVYSFAQHARTNKTITIYGANVIIIEGLYTFFNKDLLQYMDCKVYVDTDIDICYSRRMLRDIAERGRDLAGVIKQWDAFVKPNAIRYVKPTMQCADIVIPRGADNEIAMDLLIRHIRRQLQAKSIEHVTQLKALGTIVRPIDASKVHVLSTQSRQLQGIKTILLDRTTTLDDFIFYFDRVASILITRALDFVEYTSVSASKPQVVAPTGCVLKDPVFQKHEVVAVDIVRAGDCFIPSLKRTIPGIRVGKLLIQTDLSTGEPHLHTENLPALNNNCNVLLFDPQLISGAAITMAIKVLLDYNVRQDHVIVVTYLATETAITRIGNAFPEVTIVVGSVSSMDPKKAGDHDWDPWMANRFIDSRYYGAD